ncbi:hypothetical protein SLA_4604 [Streptomyces laurentii]|uniref:Uncharacterized protein n=1 Tax=Streptomyces laurentii TaxID=39478 RepID=A0A169NUS6_STRLU|nr:hypothetical protein SLA_4604 [Streptomyces laurentii]
MATPERDGTTSTGRGADTVSMRDLLAACAAADAVSTPPRERAIPDDPDVAAIPRISGRSDSAGEDGDQGGDQGGRGTVRHEAA